MWLFHVKSQRRVRACWEGADATGSVWKYYRRGSVGAEAECQDVWGTVELLGLTVCAGTNSPAHGSQNGVCTSWTMDTMVSAFYADFSMQVVSSHYG